MYAIRSYYGTTRVLTLGGSAIFNRRFTERLKAALELAAEAEDEAGGDA